MAKRELVVLKELTVDTGSLQAVQAGDTCAFIRPVEDDMVMLEAADHSSTPAATFGAWWTRDDAPNVPIFTDDDGTDWVLNEVSYGRETIFVPAEAMRPSVTNGATALADTETTAGNPDITGLSFISASDTYAQFQIEYPKAWNQGTLTFKAAWESAATGTTGVAIALQAVAVSDGDSYDTAYGTAIVVTDDAQSTPEDRYVTAESAAMTVAGTPADDDVIMFQVFRDVSADDMTEAMTLTGIRIFYTTDASTDA
jgi:hypothetical protein